VKLEISMTSLPTARYVFTEADYTWQPQLCPTCGVKPMTFVGYRGGGAHRQRLGVKCAVWACGRCGLYFPDPMPIPRHGLDQHYKVDPAEYFATHDRDAKLVRSQHLLDEAAGLLGRKGALLDVGAGRGEMLRAARESGWEATGIEPSPTFADYAAAYAGCKVICRPIEEWHFGAGTFDVVILSAILEHLYNPDATMAAVSRVLRPGGALYLEVPNERGLFYLTGDMYHRVRRTGWTIHLSPTFPPYHVFGFSPRSLRMLLRKHQLEPSVWRIFGGGFGTPRVEGLRGRIEHVGSAVVVRLSSIGSLGNYIETWALRTHSTRAA